MFGLKEKKRLTDEIDRLRKLLEQDSEDTKRRLRLANLYLEADDQQAAITEYHTAARQLSDDGLDLEPIAVYRKILGLDGISLTEKSLALVQKAEGLLIEARKTYEEALEMEPQDDEAKGASRSHIRDDHERGDGLWEEEAAVRNNTELAPIEIQPDSSHDRALSRMAPSESLGEHSSNQQTSSLITSPSEALRRSDWDSGHQEGRGFLDKAFDEDEVQDSVHEAETVPPNDSMHLSEDPQIDVSNVQMDDDLETMLSDDDTNTSINDPPPPETSEGLVNGDLSAVSPGLQETDAGEKSSQLNTPERTLKTSHPQDPDHPYSRGIACYEMDLMDKAIKEFTKAHNQGTRQVESLSMLAKCYVKKGLFRSAAGFIGQALKRDNLTPDQIEMLKEQLNEIKDEFDSADSFPSKRSGL